MKVAESAPYLHPNLKDRKDGREDRPSLQQGTLALHRPIVDLLEISSEGRKLADNAIIVHEARQYDSLPQKPIGAPDTYVKMKDLMKKLEPETYQQFQEAVNHDPKEALSILLKFVKARFA